MDKRLKNQEGVAILFVILILAIIIVIAIIISNITTREEQLSADTKHGLVSYYTAEGIAERVLWTSLLSPAESERGLSGATESNPGGVFQDDYYGGGKYTWRAVQGQTELDIHLDKDETVQLNFTGRDDSATEQIVFLQVNGCQSTANAWLEIGYLAVSRSDPGALLVDKTEPLNVDNTYMAGKDFIACASATGDYPTFSAASDPELDPRPLMGINGLGLPSFNMDDFDYLVRLKAVGGSLDLRLGSENEKGDQNVAPLSDSVIIIQAIGEYGRTRRGVEVSYFPDRGIKGWFDYVLFSRGGALTKQVPSFSEFLGINVTPGPSPAPSP